MYRWGSVGGGSLGVQVRAGTKSGSHSTFFRGEWRGAANSFAQVRMPLEILNWALEMEFLPSCHLILIKISTDIYQGLSENTELSHLALAMVAEWMTE